MGSNHLEPAGESQRRRSGLRLRRRPEPAGEAAAKKVEAALEKAPKAVKDMRQVLDDKKVDAVFIATPDHWHAPAAILALDAGKHVYVEKPCCHNIREGRLMADAVKRRANCSRSARRAAARPRQEGSSGSRDGEIGDVLVAKAWNSQRRRSSARPSRASRRRTLDFDLWVGPAPMGRIAPNLLPGIWRWWYDFGCGDIGNDGVHDIDVALWGLGVDDASFDGRLPGRQILLRRRPAVPRHAVRRLRVPRRRQAGRRSN